MLGMLLAAMEGTVVSTAMPTVIGDLHGIQLYPWVFSAYLLASTTTVPLYGKLADLFGRRPVFLFATGLFLLGSMLSGAAQSMPQLILFRAIQGLGAGGVLPLTLTVIGDIYTLQERARVQGLFTSMWGISSLGGPLLGAVITEQWSWRWVFYVNLLPGLISTFLVGAFLKEAHGRTKRAEMDYAGVFWLTGGVLSLLLLLLRVGAGEHWLSFPILGLLALTILCTAAFLRQERRAPDPMLPLSLFQNPIIAAATVGNVLIGLMMYAVDTYMPLFMQGVRGGNAHSAGVVLTPLVLFWSLSAFFGARAMLRFGFQKCTLFGVSCITLSALAMPFFSASTPVEVIILTMTLLGTGLGPSSIVLLALAQNAVPWNQRGVVTASSQFFRSISGTIGVGALGAVLNAQMAPVLAKLPDARLGPNVLLNPEARRAIPSEMLLTMQHALAAGLHQVFLLMAFLALVALLLITRLSRYLRLPDTVPNTSSAPVPASVPEPALAD